MEQQTIKWKLTDFTSRAPAELFSVMHQNMSFGLIYLQLLKLWGGGQKSLLLINKTHRLMQQLVSSAQAVMRPTEPKFSSQVSKSYYVVSIVSEEILTAVFTALKHLQQYNTEILETVSEIRGLKYCDLMTSSGLYQLCVGRLDSRHGRPLGL